MLSLTDWCYCRFFILQRASSLTYFLLFFSSSAGYAFSHMLQLAFFRLPDESSLRPHNVFFSSSSFDFPSTASEIFSRRLSGFSARRRLHVERSASFLPRREMLFAADADAPGWRFRALPPLAFASPPPFSPPPRHAAISHPPRPADSCWCQYFHRLCFLFYISVTPFFTPSFRWFLRCFHIDYARELSPADMLYVSLQLFIFMSFLSQLHFLSLCIISKQITQSIFRVFFTLSSFLRLYAAFHISIIAFFHLLLSSSFSSDSDSFESGESFQIVRGWERSKMWDYEFVPSLLYFLCISLL